MGYKIGFYRTKGVDNPDFLLLGNGFEATMLFKRFNPGNHPDSDYPVAIRPNSSHPSGFYVFRITPDLLEWHELIEEARETG